MSDTRPNTVGPYRLLAPIGRGGMGEVYRAVQEPLGREVALKLLPHDASLSPETLGRFRSEMQLAARFNHPNLVRLLDGGQTPDGTDYLAMELLDGCTLETITDAGEPLPWIEAALIVQAIAAGLGCLHAAGVLHRDVKPANVMLTSGGAVKLLDFGLAQRTGGARMTAAGAVMGTRLYMPPERLFGEPSSAAADLWALGRIAYLLLTGRHHVIYRDLASWPILLTGPFDPPSAVRAGVPPAIDALVVALLSADPATRPTAAQVVDACERAVQSVRPPRPAPAPRPRRAPPSRSLAFVGLTAATFVLLAAAWSLQRPPAPLASATPAAPAPAPARVATTLFERWRTVEPALAKLAGDEVPGAVRRATPVDLGRAPRLWRHWVRLGRWLADPKRPPDPPRDPQARAGIIDAFEDVTEFRFLKQGLPPTPAVLVEVLLLVTTQPDDPRGWLALGLFLEREGDVERARAVYAQALRRLPRTPLEMAANSLWAAVVRALALEKRLGDFPGYVRACGGGPRAWRQLHLLSGLPPRELRSLLERAAADPALTDGARQELAALMVEQEGDAAGAEAVLRALAVRSTFPREAREALCIFLLERGRGDEVYAQPGGVPDDTRATRQLPMLLADGPREVPVRARDPFAHKIALDAALEMRRRVLFGDRAGAEQLGAAIARLNAPEQVGDALRWLASAGLGPRPARVRETWPLPGVVVPPACAFAGAWPVLGAAAAAGPTTARAALAAAFDARPASPATIALCLHARAQAIPRLRGAALFNEAPAWVLEELSRAR